MGNANSGKKGDQIENGKGNYLYIDDRWLFNLNGFKYVFKY